MKRTTGDDRAVKLLQFLDRVREMQGHSMIWLVRKTGWSEPSYRRWLNGTRAIPLGAIISIADALGLDVCLQYQREEADGNALHGG